MLRPLRILLLAVGIALPSFGLAYALDLPPAQVTVAILCGVTLILGSVAGER